MLNLSKRFSCVIGFFFCHSPEGLTAIREVAGPAAKELHLRRAFALSVLASFDRDEHVFRFVVRFPLRHCRDGAELISWQRSFTERNGIPSVRS